MTNQNLLFDLKATTPLMEQYYEMKAKHPDAILLFRVGDFYETFGEDAIKTSSILGITLTSRNNGGSDIELAGFPFHSVDAYLPKLVRAGYRVAICEQLEKPSKGKKIVKRGITDLITPGVTYDSKLLDNKKNNFLAALLVQENSKMGIALADISTGEFYLAEGSIDEMNQALQSFKPSEVLLPRNYKNKLDQILFDKYYTYYLEDWIFSENYTSKKLLTHFNVHNLKGFGIEDFKLGQVAAGSILHYLDSTENTNPKHLSSITVLRKSDFLWMDKFTIRNLELIQSSSSEGKSLFEVIDFCETPMGSRMLKKWILMPLLNNTRIQERLDCVERLLNTSELAAKLNEALHSMGDLERLVSKIPQKRITPREVKHIEKSLIRVKSIKGLIQNETDILLQTFLNELNSCDTLSNQIQIQIEDEAPNTSSKGGIFKSGVYPELDELKYIVTNSKDLLLNLQKEEALKTGISNLKIGYNSVFGYYLEVTNKYKNQNLVPDHWVRKQTMSTGERYITEELKKLEEKILGAEEKILALEEEKYNYLIEQIQTYLEALQKNARCLAHLDCILSLALVAKKYNYNKPTIVSRDVLSVKNGRHPVIENQLPIGESYIPNDLFLDPNEQQIIMITGPNMSGKSAILRQTALIIILAQMGSFVPAEHAELGMIDRIFTRVGASDNIASGESTFMVEMNETAAILNNITSKSLILLDEIGRGTSTYDGISIAWSVAEFLHQSKYKPKTLFATHYHELNELAELFPRVKNFHVATKELDKTVIFLRKLIPGGSEHSFGIHVAQMAGMPRTVVLRAEQKLAELESLRSKETPGSSLHILSVDEPTFADQIVEKMLQVDTQTLSPIEALLKIHELQNQIRKFKG